MNDPAKRIPRRSARGKTKSLSLSKQVCGPPALLSVVAIFATLLLPTLTLAQEFPAFVQTRAYSNIGWSVDMTCGWLFTVRADIPVKKLGFRDNSLDGLSEDRPIAIWRDEDQALLTSTTVPAGTAAPLEDTFRWVATTPVKKASLWVEMFCWLQMLSGSTPFMYAGERVGTGSDLARSATLSKRPVATPAWAWVRQEGGPNGEGACRVAPDGRGNVYVLGAFETLTKIGDQTLNSGPGGSCFVAKYDGDGNLLWVFSPGGAGNWSLNDSAMHVDAAGNVCVIGTFQGELDFGGHKLSSERREISVIKLDHVGRVLWAAQADVLWVEDAGFVSALDGRGNVLLAGEFSGEVRVGPFVLNTAEDGLDTYLAKFDRDGRVVWARQSGTAEVDWPNALATDTRGNIYAAGASEPGAGTLEELYGTVLSKYDSQGNELWTICAERHLGRSQSRELALDATGNVFLAGQFSGILILGEQGVTRKIGGEGSYFARIGPDGRVAWLQSLGNTESDRVVDIAVDRTGDLLVAGDFAGQGNIGSTRLDSGLARGVYLAKYDRHGTALWARQIVSPSFSQPLGLQVDVFARVYLLGECGGSTGTYPHMFIASYDRDGQTLWVQEMDSDTLHMWSIFGTDRAGDCFVAGSFQGAIAFGGTALISRGSIDFFIARLTPVTWGTGTDVLPR